MVTRFSSGSGPSRRRDSLVGEEPLEIRIDGTSLVVTMRTPGNDYELAAGFLVSEGLIRDAAGFGTAKYCRGAGVEGQNPYNLLDVSPGPEAGKPDAGLSRNFPATGSCGICGTASIESVEKKSPFELSADPTTVSLDLLLGMPEKLRQGQELFERTGGLHAAALLDARTGDLLVVREDVGRHNAVDKVIGWAVLEDRLPLTGCVLQVSGRAGFELVQKASMAGLPVFSAVSAPSSLAVDLAVATGITLAGFVRGSSLVAYSRPDRILATGAEGEEIPGQAQRMVVH